LAAVAGERVKLPVTERTTLGSSESRRLRRQGLVPGVLYGRAEPVAICIGERDLRAALTTAGGSHAVLEVAIDGGREHSAILKEFQRDRIRGTITHVDLQEIRLDQKIHSSVVVTLVGEPAGVKEGGVLTQVVNEVHVEGLPLEIPQHLDVDIAGMHIGDLLRLAELPVPDGITLLDELETVLATVTMPTRMEEPGEALAEGEEGALEGVPAEEQPEGGAEGAAEPGAPAAGGEGTVEG
jgi:large subunit ribosomal protein L25